MIGSENILEADDALQMIEVSAVNHRQQRPIADFLERVIQRLVGMEPRHGGIRQSGRKAHIATAFLAQPAERVLGNATPVAIAAADQRHPGA